MKLQHAICLTTLLICCSLNTFSQTDDSPLKELVKLKFPLAEIEWEKPVSKNGVFLLNAGLGAGFSFGANSFQGSYFYYALVPYAGVGYRNYYNITKRLEQGKDISNNSANFLSVDMKAALPSIIESKDVTKTEGIFLSIVPTWGMQRSLSRNFNFEWYVGAGAGVNLGQEHFKTIYFQPAAGFAFSYLLKK